MAPYRLLVFFVFLVLMTVFIPLSLAQDGDSMDIPADSPPIDDGPPPQYTPGENDIPPPDNGDSSGDDSGLYIDD
jgi:hypothetical protein